MKYKLREFIIDPSSNAPSASRLCLLVLVLDIQLILLMNYLGYPFGAWAQLAMIIGSICGIYGFNSALRVWRGHIVEEKKEGKL
jgi:hypothetical protein